MDPIRSCALVFAFVLLASGCGGGSDSAELEALREEVAALKAPTTTAAPTTTTRPMSLLERAEKEDHSELLPDPDDIELLMRSSQFLPLEGPLFWPSYSHFGQLCPGLGWIGEGLDSRSPAAQFAYVSDYDMLKQASEANPFVVDFALDFTAIFEVDSANWANAVQQIRIASGGTGQCVSRKTYLNHVFDEWEKLGGTRNYTTGIKEGAFDESSFPRVQYEGYVASKNAVIVGLAPSFDASQAPVEDFSQFIEFNASENVIPGDYDTVSATGISESGSMEWDFLVHLDPLDVVLRSRMKATPWRYRGWAGLSDQEWDELVSDEAFRLAGLSAADFLIKFLAWAEALP